MLLILSLLVIKLAIAAPPTSIRQIDYPTDNVQIVRYENSEIGRGSYSFAFEQSDGTKHEQIGEVINEGQDDEYIVMRGVYSWVDPDGALHTVQYVADQNGFNTVSDKGPIPALSPQQG